jgi:predicted amidohydrolase YtcJ
VLNAYDAYAEIIYYNGNIITMDDSSSIYEAVAIKKYLILAVGSTKDIMKLANSHTKLIDLKGKTMLPGFYDAHSHFILNSLQKNQGFDISPPPIGKVTNIQDIIDNARQYLATAVLAAGLPVLGIGYSDIALEEKRHPNKWDLDQIATNRPIMMLHSSMHIMAVNSYALAACNITLDTLSDEMKDMFEIKDGELTGLVK